MIIFALTAQAKTGRFTQALNWAKDRAAWVSKQGCKEPVTVHVPVSGKEHSIVFMHAFDSLEEMHEFQTKVEADKEHRAAMGKGLELIVEGSVESTIYEKVL
jgi:hypothetical protein